MAQLTTVALNCLFHVLHAPLKVEHVFFFVRGKSYFLFLTVAPPGSFYF